MPKAVRRIVPGVAAVLCYTLLLNQTAYAATPAIQDAAAQTAQNAANSTSSQQAVPGKSSAPAPPAAPVPPQIAAAHTLFLSNAGAPPRYPVDATRVYNDTYANLQAWGHYQLVSSPEQADLVFELSEISPVTGYQNVSNGTNMGSHRVAIHTPAFVLTIRDPKANAVLWTITSPAYLVGHNATFQNWLGISERNLISRIKTLTNQPLSPQETTDLTTYPKSHAGLIIGLIAGGFAASAVVGLVLYEHSKSDAKADQDAFCKANNIPLSMCAGG